jgi:hypothetical protein
MSGELTIEKRIGELKINQQTVELKIGGAFALTPQYRVFSDRVTLNVDLSYKYFRVGMLAGIMVIHETLTALGFNGIQNTDWKLTGAILAGTPAGSDKQLQYNNAGAFGGMSGVLWTNTTKKLQLGESSNPIIEEHEGQIIQIIQNCGNQSGTYAINCSSYNDHIITAINNLNIQLANVVSGQGGIIILKIDNTGGYTITLDAGSFTKKLKGSDAIDTVANKINFISYWNDGTYVYYTVTNEA